MVAVIVIDVVWFCYFSNFFFVEKITAADIQRVAKRMLATPPSLAARGEINEIQELADIQAGLLNSEGRMPGSSSKRMSFFR